MIDTLGHHLIPLLSLPGAAGALGCKAHLAAVKVACKSAERIHGALGIAGRFEIAVVPGVPDFFDPSHGMTKARNLAWEMIRNTQRLQWVIPTRHPEHICRSLPATWVCKGYQNVCIGLVADGADGFPEKLQALRNAPLQHRMMILNSNSPLIEFATHLQNISWVVFCGKADDRSRAEEISASCHEANIAFLFHQTESDIKFSAHQDAFGENPPCLPHPFGTKFDLFQPTLPHLKSASFSNIAPTNPHAEVVIKSEPPATAAMEITVPSLDVPQTLSISTTEPPTEIMNIEVVTQDADKPGIKSPVLSLSGTGDMDLDDFNRLDNLVRRGLATFIEVGQALAEIRVRKLWRAGGHANWAAYCQVVGGLTKTHANRLINSSEIAGHLAQVTPIGVTPTAESQVRPLSKLKQPEQQVLAWSRATERANGQPTAKLICDVVAELMADETPVASSKPNRKQLVAETIRKIRTLNAAGRAKEQIETLLNELETLLNLPDPQP